MPCEGIPSFTALHLGLSLQTGSRFIGKKIDAMEAAHIQYLELAATADFLFNLVSSAPLFTRIKHKKMNESKSGADFEWWIGSGPLWLGIRVQAKRHFRQTTSGLKDYYGDLDKTVTNKKTGLTKFQVDLLIDDCKTRGRVPLHMFFESECHASPSRIAKCGNSVSGDLWGVSIADSYEVQRLVNASLMSGPEVRKILQPVSCLPLCSGASGSLNDRVMSSIRKNIWGEGRQDGPFPEPKELPKYVRDLFDEPGELVEKLPYGLDAILLMQEEPFAVRQP